MTRILNLLIVLIFPVLLLACSQEQDIGNKESTIIPVQDKVAVVKNALQEPVALERVELATEAIAIWRQYSTQQPTLLLLSDEPMLLPVPIQVAAAAINLIATAERAEIARRSYPWTADVLVVPDMTVDIALRQQWLGKLIWALPFRNAQQPLTPDLFRNQLLTRGLATEEEAATFGGTEKLVSGTLRGVPVEMATIDNLPVITGPVIIHIDQSYFKNLYTNNVATPLLNIVFETLTKLREKQIPVLAVTFSYGNLDERIALDVRFVGDIIAALFAEPDLFEQPVPEIWERQGQILMLNDFFQKEKQRELALIQEQALPDVAWPKFNLYQSAATYKEGGLALDYLSQAVQLDKIYALEYLLLADHAYKKNLPKEALRMLGLADAALPDNPMIRLKIAQMSFELGDRDSTLQIVRELQSLPWSTIYQLPVEKYLKDFKAYLETEPDLSQKEPAPATSFRDMEVRQRLLHIGKSTLREEKPHQTGEDPRHSDTEIPVDKRVLHPEAR